MLLRDTEWRATEALDMFSLSEAFASMVDTDEDDPAALGVLHTLLRVALHDEDWPRFRRWAKEQKPPLGTDEMMGLAQALIGEAADRPQVTSSESQPGQSSAGLSSVGVSSSPDSHRHLGLVPVDRSGLWQQAS